MRLVAKGFSQEEGNDDEETLNALITLATDLDLEMEMMDTASFNSELSKEINMKLQEIVNLNNSVINCRMNREIYGLKQSG